MVKPIPYTMRGETTMKTKEELNTLKEEVNTLSAKLRELTDDELAQIIGGTFRVYQPLNLTEIRTTWHQPT